MYLGYWKKGLKHGDGIARVVHYSILDPIGMCLCLCVCVGPVLLLVRACVCACVSLCVVFVRGICSR